GESDPESATQASLAAMMVGREVILTVEKPPAQPGPPALEVEALTARTDLGEPALRGVSVNVHAGEILGVAGVQGNGQTELVEVLTGLRPAQSATIRINQIDMTNASPRRITAQGQSCHVPEDRHTYGMVDTYSVAYNLVLNTYYLPPFARGWTVQDPAIRAHAERLVAEYDVRTPDVDTLAGNLSG